MDGLTTTKGLTRRGRLAAFAIAMLLSLAAISTPAQAQETRFPFNAFGGFRGGVSVGAARGQTVRIVFRTTNDIGPLLEPSGKPDVIVAGSGVTGHVKVFDSTGARLQIQDLTTVALGLHSIDINRDELAVVGEPGTGRIQLWIELLIDPCRDGRGRAEAARVSLFPTFEVIDNVSGATTVRGEINQTGLITFTGLE